LGASIAAPPNRYLRSLFAPSRAEQESETGNKCERHVGPLLDRFIDGVDKIVGDIAHGIDRFAALILRAGHDVIDAGARPLPRRVAFVAEDIADLLGEPREIVAECLKIALKVARRLRRRPLNIAQAFAGVLGRITNVVRYR
jgi:hypothetical protein